MNDCEVIATMVAARELNMLSDPHIKYAFVTRYFTNGKVILTHHALSWQRKQGSLLYWIYRFLYLAFSLLRHHSTIWEIPWLSPSGFQLMIVWWIWQNNNDIINWVAFKFCFCILLHFYSPAADTMERYWPEGYREMKDSVEGLVSINIHRPDLPWSMFDRKLRDFAANGRFKEKKTLGVSSHASRVK